MVIGVDNGNSNTKTVHEIFRSGVTEHDVYPPLADEVLEFKGKYYTLSSKRMTFVRDKTKTDECFILTLFAIAKEIKATESYTKDFIDLSLSVGLPPAHYSIQEKKFKKYFQSFGPTIEFKLAKNMFRINLKSVHVYPQGYAAAITKVSLLKRYSKTYIIDIGGYTTDVLLLVNGQPDLSCVYSIENGIITMNNDIINRINIAHEMKIDDQHIEDVLNGKECVLDSNLEIVNLIKSKTVEHTNNILNELREHGVDLKSNPAIFLGGGASLLASPIKNSPMTSIIEFIPDISANANGYTILASAELRKNNSNKNE